MFEGSDMCRYKGAFVRALEHGSAWHYKVSLIGARRRSCIIIVLSYCTVAQG